MGIWQTLSPPAMSTWFMNAPLGYGDSKKVFLFLIATKMPSQNAPKCWTQWDLNQGPPYFTSMLTTTAPLKNIGYCWRTDIWLRQKILDSSMAKLWNNALRWLTQKFFLKNFPYLEEFYYNCHSTDRSEIVITNAHTVFDSNG